MDTPNISYYSLYQVLHDAYEQARSGKGHDRHNKSEVNFEDQPIFWIDKYFKNGHLYQAVKKIHESQALSPERAIAELHGAINYLAARVIVLNNELRQKEETTKERIMSFLRSDLPDNPS